ncbi:uncharacterized protein LOC114119106 isoform X1 [Aphis gossypii]|uniref:Uncharacterized protein n=1 Tax=Aphis gossypii TaxID=80765 RepID=A0A9P0J4G4_APHGO|nr:uncharacterized protein LOC114119106 isoform X1 [Aphis gossypii]CAH1725573.1 unnamed protein product [Aphis gossypii]
MISKLSRISFIFIATFLISRTIAVVHQPQTFSSTDLPTVDSGQEPPEGYYAFIEAPRMEPPQVRSPPYFKSNKLCPGVNKNPSAKTLNNLCGDLNKAFLPVNPMKQNVLGTPYPFELMKNKTLEFFSRTLPILKADETIPKVAKYVPPESYYHSSTTQKYLHGKPFRRRAKYTNPDSLDDVNMEEDEDIPINSQNSTRHSRKFCDTNGGVFCMLYKVIQGQALSGLMAQRRTEQLEYRTRDPAHATGSVMDGPPTPCPAKVEYATPVFARNYQGMWRYVVQIPYEGYFTQTVEVTKCTQTKCHYIEGGCLSSPRWVSLLVAEVYYPDTYLPSVSNNRRLPVPPQQQGMYKTQSQGDEPPSVQDFQNYQQYLHKRATQGPADPLPSQSSTSTSKKKHHCDGVDELGCFQVRLYYDWFLIPGSCKCWRPDYFSRYVKRKSTSPEL